MISDYTLQERSKILEWLIEDNELADLPCRDTGFGVLYNADEVWHHIETNRKYWDK